MRTTMTAILVFGFVRSNVCTARIVCAKTPAEAVVYTALRPDNWDLYLFASPGEPPRRLTDHPDLDYNPAISPDGRWLVFTSERRGNPDLYVIDLDGDGSARLLVDSDAMEDAATFSPDGKRLALVSTQAGNAEISSVPFLPTETLEPAKVTNLTQNSAGDFNPAFSPDGKQIAFSSDRDGYKASEIYVMNADGSEASRLTESPGWDGSPVWSPDGKAIYSYSERDGRPRIYRMNRDGSQQQPVTAAARDAVSPTFAPTGRLAYAVKRNGRWQVASANPDGSDTRLESEPKRQYWAPAYHPKTGQVICHGTGPASETSKFNSGTPGRFLVNDRQQVKLPDRSLSLVAVRGYFPATNSKTSEVASDEGFHHIVISGLDGSNIKKVFSRKGQRVWRPTWSKDGKWLACAVGRTFAEPQADVDIWKLRPDGSDAANLTADSSDNDAFPDFSPDGRQLVFRSGRDGNHEIYLMDADGRNVQRLTDHTATDTMPAFGPEGKSVAFTSNRAGDYELYILEILEGDKPGKLRRMTHSKGRDTHPKFSPDGKWLVSASERGGSNDETPLIPVFNPQPYGEIFAMRVKDGKVVRLTHNKWEDGTPTWAIHAQRQRK